MILKWITLLLFFHEIFSMKSKLKLKSSGISKGDMVDGNFILKVIIFISQFIIKHQLFLWQNYGNSNNFREAQAIEANSQQVILKVSFLILVLSEIRLLKYMFCI